MIEVTTRLFAALSIALLTGCLSSTPASNYYLLSAQAGESAQRDEPAVGIGPITVPEYLNRNGIVYSRDGNQLQIASFERWAEPLLDGIQRVISINLSGLLNTQNIQPYPWPRSSAPDYGVQINVLTLDANASEARLVVEWSINRAATGEVLSRRISRLRQAMPTTDFTPALVAPAYSELLYQLAAEMAQQVKADANR